MQLLKKDIFDLNKSSDDYSSCVFALYLTLCPRRQSKCHFANVIFTCLFFDENISMADGRFLRGHGLNLYHLQFECFELFCIWEPPLYTLVYRRCEMSTMPKLRYLFDPLDHCGTMADGPFLRGHGLNLYHLQYKCLGMLSIWVTSLQIRVYRCLETWAILSWGISETP